MRAFIFGAGAHGRVTLDILRAQGKHKLIEFIDDNEQLWGQRINGASIVGGLNYALQQDKETFEMVVALGNPITRLTIAKKLKEHFISLLNAVHPLAVVVPTATISEGNMISAAAVINSNAVIGNNVIINTSAVIEHDCVLDDGVTVSSGCNLGGRVTVGSVAFISTGAIVLPRVSIGVGAVVGAGAVVTKDVPDRVLVRGVPAQILEHIDETFDWNRLL